MSDLTRYEKELAQKLKQLPLPNEDASWEDMSRLLDENDDKIVPPYRRNIVLGSLIAALLIGSLCFLISKRQSNNNKKIDTNQQVIDKEGTENGNQQNDKDLSSTNNQVVNKEATTTNKIHNSVRSTNINTTGTNRYNNDQTQLTTTNKELNINQQVINSKVTDNNNQQNDKVLLNTNNLATKKDVRTTNKANNSARSKNSNTSEATPYNNDKTQLTTANNNLNNREQTTNNNPRNNKEQITTSNNQPLYNNTSARNETKHTVVVKSDTKKSLNNDVVNNSDAIINTNNIGKIDANDNTMTADDLSRNNHTVNSSISSKTNNNKAVRHSYSTTAASTKKHTKFSQRKNYITTSTKGKVKFNIYSPTAEEDIEDNIDTAQLIRIGTYVLAKKKATHHLIKKDTNTAKPLALTAKDSSTATKKKDGNKKQLHVSIGIGEQQAIRLNCDCVYPNDAYTKSSLATDYIPSVYVKIQPSKKWFIQAELKYKAAQYIQEQLYKNNISNQPLNYTTTTSVVKKVYYNQIPISFDYVIIPNLSVGVGMIYNNFAGEVSQNDVRKKLYGTTADSSISSSTVTNRNGDSLLSFTKNSFQGLIEAQYEWKHFTFGVRYAIGLQPYLKYNSPTTGNLIEKKNDALTVFIHFELWDSKSKKKK